ncbi:hypothetical protein QOZ80_5BG0456870 [Eleusine coracana subsp. coracana]|nr:hypothetical protein QOZ80_5BG0456870 [Eleusine coracana subsp. coracana]
MNFLVPMTGVKYALGSAIGLRLQKRRVINEALESQEVALKVAKEKLCPTSPIRLSTALKTSHLYDKYLKRTDLYNQLENFSERPYQIVQQAIDDAECEMKSCNDGTRETESKDTEKCMVLLRIKLALLKYEKHQSTGMPADVTKAAAGLVKIKVLCLAFYLVDNLQQQLRTIGQAIAAAAAADYVEMKLLPDVHFRKRTEERPTVCGQRLIKFLDACPGAFRCLTSLSLCCLRFADPDMPCILSACHRLHHLRLDLCGGGVLRVDVPPTSQLITLNIVKGKFSRVELVSAPRLERLFLDTWMAEPNPPLQLGNVPQLHYIWLASALLSFQEEPFNTTTNLITLSTLHLNFKDDKVCQGPNINNIKLQLTNNNVFLNLKDLYLHDILIGYRSDDLNWTLLLLQAAPSLKSFHVKISWHTCYRNSNKLLLLRYPPPAAAAETTNVPLTALSFKHHSLELLELQGIKMDDDSLISYARLVMERAVSLKRIRLLGVENCTECQRLDPEEEIPFIREAVFPRNEGDKKLVREQLLASGSSVQLIMERPQDDARSILDMHSY